MGTYSPFNPLENDLQNYRLSPNGQHSGIAADRWTLLADIETRHVPDVLHAMTKAGIGAYARTGAGRRTNADGARTEPLFVDTTCYNRAEELLMNFLRGKSALPAGARAASAVSAHTNAAPSAIRGVAAKISAVRAIPAVRWLSTIAGAVALIALAMFLAYHYGPTRFPAIHSPQPPLSGPTIVTPDVRPSG
ncbi:hypothetical protein A5784_09325 [Mycobacterium sp. 852013-50091_SCH5140682]|uniref:hypothetical protein n=1 Tax=Mycobacterium sp. 852013-50091_SCH5140682 TaxID=1834109 RepID=UPI0007EABCA2|nr:hypothetical protein [Mycobacterium sp. 852013-50091_SCH5140682]OBC07007.1 hypothetical protein A5784_09325 [Mycobacterium sp. 852013-50091_SCH5140682]